MESTNRKKVLGRLGLFYGVIISAINYLGFMIISKGNMPVRQTEDYIIWMEFMNRNTGLINFVSILSFVIPIVICCYYVTVCKQEDVNKRIINLPIVYASFGAFGWIFSCIFELLTLLIMKLQVETKIINIALSSFMNISEMCLFIWTTAFLCLNTIHRKRVLPKYFPEGNVTQHKGSIKYSTIILFTVFFLAVSIFPIFYLTSSIYIICSNLGITVQKSIFVVLTLIIVFGIFILVTFANQFAEPMKQILKVMQSIKSEKYDERVDVVSCDDLGELADNFNDMAKSLDIKTKKIYAMQDSVIKGMAVMVESRDNSTGGHINRTSDCVKVFIEKLQKNPEYSKLTESFCKAVIKAAPMHDLGKIAVDDAVLRKPGRFTDEEYEMMKKHSAEGARIVENVLHEVDDEEFKQIAINVAHYHHEKWDGSGYPEKISKENIPLEARIMALADVFDALVSKRCYKDSMSYDKAFTIIQDSLGTHFDPVLGKIFIETRSELEELYNGYN